MWAFRGGVLAELTKLSSSRHLVALFERRAQHVVTASVVVHEMWFGIERLLPSKRRAHLERFMTEVVGALRVLPYGKRAARWHARERARLAALGQQPPFADGQIAAIARVSEATLVTANTKDFSAFDGLLLENWLG